MRTLITIFALLISFQSISAQDFFMGNDTEDSFTASLSNENAFRIGSAGEFGCTPRNKNCAEQMHRSFTEINPEGVVIGKDDRTIVFTSAEAIQAFLPSNGSAKTLSTGMIDPTSRDFRSNYASNVLALTLSLKMDENDESFAASQHKLSDCSFVMGLFAGVKVTRFLDECNKVLAGQPTTMPAQAIERQLYAFNANYQSGSYSDVLVQPTKKSNLIR